ncbi:MAG: LacI family DNA-binding transcriptional regulator [Specibacter sp.]
MSRPSSYTPEAGAGATPVKPATIHDVAALSGVAASTVSRALSTPARVNFRTRARIEAAAAQLLVDAEESEENEVNTIEQLQHTADGVILTASRLSDQALLTASLKIPLVTINRDIAGVASVMLDTPTATNQALDHLISLGHSHVAYLSGPDTSSSSQRR